MKIKNRFCNQLQQQQFYIEPDDRIEKWKKAEI